MSVYINNSKIINYNKDTPEIGSHLRPNEKRSRENTMLKRSCTDRYACEEFVQSDDFAFSLSR